MTRRRRHGGSAVRRATKSTRVRAGLALGTVLAVGATGTWAYWTDSATVSGVTISTGTLDLKVNGADSVTGYTQMNVTGMVPGNTTAGTLTVSNAGTVGFTYTAASTVTSGSSALATALTTQVRVGGTVSGAGTSATCTGGTLLGDAGTLNGNVITTARALAAGGSETLCLQATLPTNAANTLQGQTVSVQLTFTATQA